MEHSSRRNPCPVCFRDTNDKCRWNDHAILCFVGDSFHPPLHLILNDVIAIGDKDWKLIRTNAGFAGSSHLFVKLDGLELLTPLQRRRQIKEKTLKFIDIRNQFSEARNLVYKSLSVPEFENLTYHEFVEYKKITHQALNSCEKLLSLIAVNKNQVILKKYTIEALRYWRKTLRFHLKDFLAFEINQIGTTLASRSIKDVPTYEKDAIY